ncbi:MAG: hypothetical protein DRP42_02350 [Tenericutes bacterium]|nr:MAG: hypothetical protein DRP42_02350 [Mycoplasmatota bacterium]
MIKAAIKTHGNKQIQVKNFEIKIKHTSYTIDTIKMLTEKYPEYEFYLIMGDDAYLKIDS